MKSSKKSAMKIGNLGLAVMILVFLLVGYMIVFSKQRMMGKTSISMPSRESCMADDCLMVQNLEYPVAELPVAVKLALEEAITDEYKALTVYQKVTEKLGMVRPFSMIMGAEEQHIASLKVLFDKYGVDVPQNMWGNKVTAPKTLVEACQTGVDAEIANAALYEKKLLPAVSEYEDITLVFTNLMNASAQKHLPAFEKCN